MYQLFHIWPSFICFVVFVATVYECKTETTDQSSTTEPPNIIVMYSDDHTAQSIGAYREALNYGLKRTTAPLRNIRNFAPERWPAGSPRRIEDGELTPMHVGYHDIDAAPSLDVMTEKADDPYFNQYLYLAVGRRPAEELYDIKKDPGCINNLALNPGYKELTGRFRHRLLKFLEATGDPRVTESGNIWESYSRLRGPMHEFPAPEWALPVKDRKR